MEIKKIDEKELVISQRKKEIEIAKKLYLKYINQKRQLKIICFI